MLVMWNLQGAESQEYFTHGEQIVADVAALEVAIKPLLLVPRRLPVKETLRQSVSIVLSIHCRFVLQNAVLRLVGARSISFFPPLPCPPCAVLSPPCSCAPSGVALLGRVSC